MSELARFADRLVKAHENQWYDFETNGEAAVLRALSTVISEPPIIFDVGANIGEWTGSALRLMPTATVHAFELVPSTATVLETRFAHDGRVRINPCGLADCSRPADVTVYSHDTTMSTLLDLPHQVSGSAKTLVRASLTSGDEYVRTHGIDRIDFLKIDVEGAEWSVLQGFADTLRAGVIRAVQFEYGRANIVAHRLLFDFYGLFREHGYGVGKIYPDSVAFREYRWEQEDFIGPNFLAVHANDRELLAALPAG